MNPRIVLVRSGEEIGSTRGRGCATPGKIINCFEQASKRCSIFRRVKKPDDDCTDTGNATPGVSTSSLIRYGSCGQRVALVSAFVSTVNRNWLRIALVSEGEYVRPKELPFKFNK